MDAFLKTRVPVARQAIMSLVRNFVDQGFQHPEGVYGGDGILMGIVPFHVEWIVFGMMLKSIPRSCGRRRGKNMTASRAKLGLLYRVHHPYSLCGRSLRGWIEVAHMINDRSVMIVGF
ncbi:hypothetical protein M408DRAFT_118031 [Serendipita vermifera MAFF 305830]|uniref:Uncharacterized protein n=1 Tax=Serendipita vermifera MAFF 305830 TaxID=933852 RepID=A0A0C3ALK3_SERVB|nr:hypothetical protein M408DRAFT_118031 [Serendipita vermifera MAFF 305830]